jgi:glycerate 2-kinase
LTTLRETGEEIFRAALEACSVGRAFARKVCEVSRDVLELEGDGEVDLAGVKRVLVVAMGKGAAPMLEALLGYRAVTEGREVVGVLVSPVKAEGLREGITYFAGGHPSPNAASMESARAVLALLREAAKSEQAAETFCFILISGGASSMVELPLDESIMLDELVGFHRALVHSGGSITEINCVRKHFSAVKGGRLALAAAGLRSLTMVVSDVPAGQLDVLASGPTLPDTSTMTECRAVLEKYDLMARFPEGVREFFLSSRFVESPKPGEVEARVYALLSSDDLAAEARKAAEQRGFAVAVDNTCDDWEYEAAAEYLLGRVRELRVERARVCLISAGEVTVRLPAGGSGQGGRNQHLALYSALRLGDGEAVMSAGSDGIDGNSPAAGAAVDRGTVAGREDEGRRALDEFSSYGFLREAGAVIMTGPSGNNLRDLRVLLAE